MHPRLNDFSRAGRQKGQKKKSANTYEVLVSHAYASCFGRQGWRFFYEQAPLQKRDKLSEPLQLSIPQARNFGLC